MAKTLLIDLDNTLLQNSMEKFLPAYLQALAKRLAPFIEPERMIKTLLAATNKMIENTRPDLSLMEVFDQAFFHVLGIDKSQLIAHFEDFYATDFPHLSYTTAPIPAAIGLVQQAFKKGYQIGIATNPLFPRTAILQRLTWAELSPNEYPFALVPSYDSFHFSKPNPAFYMEFLAQMGWPEGVIAMIGDEPEMDIQPARLIGMPVFWIQENPEAIWNGSGPEPRRGSPEDVLSWLETDNIHPTSLNFNIPDVVASAISATPAALLTLSKQFPEKLWASRPASGEWSLTEIICHLRDVDTEVNLPRLKKVVENQNPFLASQNTDPWAEDRQYIRQEGQQAMNSFIEARLEMQKLINSLDTPNWDKPARHAIFGPTTFKELLGIIAGHDRLHIRQVHKLVTNKEEI